MGIDEDVPKMIRHFARQPDSLLFLSFVKQTKKSERRLDIFRRIVDIWRMGTLTRKQREVQERGQLLLQVARKMLIEQGYAGLSMDQLAEVTEYSKGTIYQHFSTKEDLVTALAIETMERRVALFQRAENFVGRSRERLTAIGVADEIFGRLEPHHYQSEFIIKLANLPERASPERREALGKMETTCFGTVVRVVESAMESGELSKDVDPREVVYNVFTMALGTHMTAIHNSPMLKKFEISDPPKVLQRGIQRLLDGFGWRPLSNEWDYNVSTQRILSEVFSQERHCLEGP